MSSEQPWKDKYLQELEDSEQREARSEKEKDLLRRMLVRTSLASEGQNSGLDSLLTGLRDELRKGSFDERIWHDLQDRIDRKVAALDEQTTTSDQQLLSTLESLISALRNCPQFAPANDQLKGLEKRLRKPETFQQYFKAWLTDFADALQRALIQNADSPAPRGVFGKLFHKQPTAEQPPEFPDTEYTTIELAPEAQEASGQRLRIARRVGEFLGHLLEQVVLEPESESRARRLQESLLANDDWRKLRDDLSGVADLVISAVTQSQREFETFLRRLDERLDVLRSCFLEQESAQADRLGATEELDREIQQELQTFGQQVDDSEDFQALKQSVSGHLQSIRQAVGHFRANETEREEHLSEQLSTMQEKVALMETQAEQMRGQLRHERQRAMTDVLTQLPNRAAWQDRLELEFQRWRRYGNPLSLAVLDIDYFKRVNDSFGHKAGDRVLQLVANGLRDHLRQTDFIARFGGEEFVLLFPETDIPTAKSVLEGLKEHVTKLPFHFRGQPVSVTFSAGVAGFKAGDEMEAVFDRADKSLYHAKESGRDQVSTAD